MIISSCIHVAANYIILFFFMTVSSIPLYRCTTSLYVVCFKLMFSKFDWSFSYWDNLIQVAFLWSATFDLLFFLLKVFVSISIVGLASLFCLYCFFSLGIGVFWSIGVFAQYPVQRNGKQLFFFGVLASI